MLVLRLLGGLAFLVPLALYLASAGGYPAFWDTGELQTVPYILGIAHPTGFPLFTLAGWLVSHAVPLGSVAWRINAMCALAAAGAAWMLWRVAVRVGAFPPLALLAAWWFAFGEVVWTRATRADVHDLALLLGALAIGCALEYHLEGDPRLLRWCALWLGLGLANHPVALWLVPGLAILVLARGRALSVRTLATCAAIVAAALMLYAYLPLRSAVVAAAGLDPARLLPGMDGGFLWDYNHPSTWHGFLAEVSGSQFGAGSTLAAALDLGSYPTYVTHWLREGVPEFGLFGIVASLIGLVVLALRDWRAALGLSVAACAAVPFAVAFRDVEGDVARYFLLSFWMVGVGIACWLPAAWLTRGAVIERASAWLALFCTALFVGRMLHGNLAILQQRDDRGARSVIDAVRAATPSGAVVVAPWLDATALGYAAYVERSLDHRIIVSAWPDDIAAEYPAWMHLRPVYLAVGREPRVPGLRVRRVSPRYAPIGVYEVLP
ncbi:DUF2723 domain-containing protein [bacterium]|nr:MAG: DUF2723 domain-containing protein [bacterium]